MRHLAFIAIVAACGGPPAPVKSVAPPPPAAVPADPITAEQIMEASIVAQGGREALGKLTSIKGIGTVSVAGLKGKFVTLTAPPRNSLMTLDIAGIGKIAAGSHDDLAWESTAMSGARLLSGVELSTTLRDSTFNGDLFWKTLFPKIVLVGDADFAGQKTWKLTLTSADGEEQTRYVAKDTKYVVGEEMIEKTQMGAVPVSVIQSDFRKLAGGIMVPFAIKRSEGPQSIEITIESVELNVPLDPKAFELPDEIKALVDKAKAKG